MASFFHNSDKEPHCYLGLGAVWHIYFVWASVIQLCIEGVNFIALILTTSFYRPHNTAPKLFIVDGIYCLSDIFLLYYSLSYSLFIFLFLYLASKERWCSQRPGTGPQSPNEEQLIVVLFFLITLILIQLPIGEKDAAEDTSSDGVKFTGQAGEGQQDNIRGYC